MRAWQGKIAVNYKVKVQMAVVLEGGWSRGLAGDFAASWGFRGGRGGARVREWGLVSRNIGRDFEVKVSPNKLEVYFFFQIVYFLLFDTMCSQFFLLFYYLLLFFRDRFSKDLYIPVLT